MEIIKLPSEIRKERKHFRSANRRNNKNAYSRLKNIMVPNEIKLAEFRKYYHPVASTQEKEILLCMGIDPWSIEGIKYLGDCKRYKIKLGNPISFSANTDDQE